MNGAPRPGFVWTSTRSVWRSSCTVTRMAKTQQEQDELDEFSARVSARRAANGQPDFITNPDVYRVLDGIMAAKADEYLAPGETPPWYEQEVSGFPFGTYPKDRAG